MAWNYRGLGGPFTISQLKDSIRLTLPDEILLCETKQSTSFLGTVCKKLKYENRWEVNEPIGKKGGMLVAWNKSVKVKEIRKTTFSLEVCVEQDSEVEDFWIVFVHASTDTRERQMQWTELEERK